MFFKTAPHSEQNKQFSIFSAAENQTDIIDYCEDTMSLKLQKKAKILVSHWCLNKGKLRIRDTTILLIFVFAQKVSETYSMTLQPFYQLSISPLE